MDAAMLARWYNYVKSHDHAELWDMLHPDVVFESPVVFTPQRGREITFKYLQAAEKVLASEGFRYVGEWQNDTSVILEFERDMDGIHVNGIDMIWFDADGRIIRMKVMVRPLKAIQAVLPRMAGYLAA